MSCTALSPVSSQKLESYSYPFVFACESYGHTQCDFETELIHDFVSNLGIGNVVLNMQGVGENSGEA